MNRRTFLSRLVAAPFVAALAALGWKRPEPEMQWVGYRKTLSADELNADFNALYEEMNGPNKTLGSVRFSTDGGKVERLTPGKIEVFDGSFEAIQKQRTYVWPDA